MTLRLLMTARDAGASFHLIEVARAALAAGDIALEVATQMPASRYFADAGIPHRALPLPAARAPDDASAAALLACADGLVETVRPDAVLCGLSTPGDGGIDEAVIARFAGPSLVLQDFWGEVNAFFGRAADLYLALDEEGVLLPRTRHGREAVAIGSPRHSAYAGRDLPAVRAAMRARIGAGAGTAVLGFFGQALHGLEGYRRTLEAWARAVLAFPGRALAVYRPHPREKPEEAAWTVDRLRALGIATAVLGDCSVEDALLACDVVCSAFSNCTYDTAYLNRFSPEPLATPVSLFFDPQIVDYFHRMVRLDEFPYLKAGLVLPVRNAADLAGAIRHAAGTAARRQYWEAAQRLADPQQAPLRALTEVRRLAARAGAPC